MARPTPAPGRRDELRDFLRTRRARLAPADVGMPDGGRRRMPGLRREEVAVLFRRDASRRRRARLHGDELGLHRVGTGR
ncbi:hypothetical protein [Actinomadura monticuli]|uniref:hypothetical protein n=1 Tax=Actinomadura monticuli TaxID=3097367 RepID=UPI003FCEE508